MTNTSVQYFEIDDDHANRRLDNFLLTKLKVPKGFLYRLIRIGGIKVNHKRVKPDYRLKSGDQIRVAAIETKQPEKEFAPSKSLIDKISQSILYEDHDIMVINKPVGLAVHGGTGIHAALIETLRYMFPKEHFLELVHRLDLETSGCLLIAKKHRVLVVLHEQLRERKIKKRYLALTLGHWPKKMNKVELALQKNTLNSGERIVKVLAEGKPSLTEFHVKQKFEQAELVDVILHTGRTHQIRVHAQYSGHPVAGDPKYGDRAFNNLMKKQGLKRLFLHAHQISFILPSSGQKIIIEAPLDDELNQVLANL